MKILAKYNIEPVKLLWMMVAGIVSAFGITCFLSPMHLYDSGIAGTSLLLSQLTPPFLNLSFFLVVLNTQSTPTEVSEEEEEGGKPKRSRFFWAPIALAAASSLMLVNRIIQGAVEAGEYTGMKSANTGFTVWGILLSTLISCCFYLSYLCIAIREGIAKNG